MASGGTGSLLLDRTVHLKRHVPSPVLRVCGHSPRQRSRDESLHPRSSGGTPPTPLVSNHETNGGEHHMAERGDWLHWSGPPHGGRASAVAVFTDARHHL